MILSDSTYVGIDPTSGQKELTFAALDSGLNLVAMEDATIDELLSLLRDQKSVVVAINAPSQVNRGVTKAKLKRDNPTRSRPFRGVDIRSAEYELKKRGISVIGTPGREELCPSWMRMGFSLYQRLFETGFESLTAEGVDRRLLETHPFACFCVLLEQIPFPKSTLEGRLQRQLVLHEKGLRIRDPLDFFVEITRFKLLKGILPLEIMYSTDQLDVLVAALTAWMAVNQAEDTCSIGDELEGKIILPTNELRDEY